MMFGKHAAYILPAYGITAIVIACMIFWILVVHRKHKQQLTNLEAKGIKRRSASKNPNPKKSKSK